MVDFHKLLEQRRERTSNTNLTDDLDDVLNTPLHDDLPDDDLPEAFRGLTGFLTGAAGSGKTFLAKALAAERRGWTMAASTGIAAVNLGEATTINSLLGYFDEDSLRTAMTQGFTQAKLRKLQKSGLHRILLDEVSMVSAESLLLIMMALDEVNSDLPTKEKIGLTLIGDFCQLPPVKGQFAFESSVWAERFAPFVTTLTEIRRQADPAFIEGLRAARRGDITGVVEYFGPRCVPIIEQHYPGLTIFSKNDQVKRWNELAHIRLMTAVSKFPSRRDGVQKTEWVKHIDDELLLKAGALVMVLANNIEEGHINYANGDLGTFVGQTEIKTRVEEKSEDGSTKYVTKLVKAAVVKLQRTDDEVTIAPVVRLNQKPTGAMGVKKERYETIGAIEFMPLRLAWASTVHKIQGLSMDHVQVAIADQFFKSPAMLYVALSRARSAEGLRLVGTPMLLRERCATDARVGAWL